MLKRNRKGFSLIELLITMAIVGLFSPLVFALLVTGIEDYSTTSKYMSQQYSVMEVTRLIRQDIEEAKKINIKLNDYIPNMVDEVEFVFDLSDSPTKPKRKWMFGKYTDDATGNETYGLFLSIDEGAYQRVVDKLDSECSFKVDQSKDKDDKLISPTNLILTIKPENLNKTRYIGRNVKENIITEFSVRYKVIDYK